MNIPNRPFYIEVVQGPWSPNLSAAAFPMKHNQVWMIWTQWEGDIATEIATLYLDKSWMSLLK